LPKICSRPIQVPRHTPSIVSPSCLDPFEQTTYDSAPGRPMHLHSSRVEVLSLIVDVRDESGGEAGGDDAVGE